MRLVDTILQQLMREIRRTILEDIAETLHQLGFIGSKMDAGNLIGQVPIGSARIVIQHDGTQVGDPTYIINFVGPAFTVEADPTNNRINIGVPLAAGPSQLITDALDDIQDDATVLMVAG
jgi:hypothetical protein